MYPTSYSYNIQCIIQCIIYSVSNSVSYIIQLLYIVYHIVYHIPYSVSYIIQCIIYSVSYNVSYIIQCIIYASYISQYITYALKYNYIIRGIYLQNIGVLGALAIYDRFLVVLVVSMVHLRINTHLYCIVGLFTMYYKILSGLWWWQSTWCTRCNLVSLSYGARCGADS